VFTSTLCNSLSVNIRAPAEVRRAAKSGKTTQWTPLWMYSVPLNYTNAHSSDDVCYNASELYWLLSTYFIVILLYILIFIGLIRHRSRMW